jgi:glycosyltransferase involved in cell wall biosynthesis
MRINFVLPQVNLAGGIRVLALYATRLQARGHRVAVRSIGPPRRSAKTAVRQWLTGTGRERASETTPSHFDGLEIDHQIITPARPIGDRDLPDGDVVIATWWETAEWVARLSPRKGAKVHFIQHDESIFAGQPGQRVIASWQLPLRKITVSHWLTELARQRHPGAAAQTVPNSVDRDLFDGPPRGKQRAPTVGLIYSDSAFKGTDVAIEAIRRARRDLPDLKVVAFGMHPERGALPLPRDTHYVERPAQAHIAALYQSVDAWLFASRSEGFGLPLLEAMACRTPVIATPAGAAPELLADGGGWLLPRIDDPEAMCRAILEMHSLSDAAWQAVSQQARHIATRYDWDDATDHFEAALRAAMYHPAPPRVIDQPATAMQGVK